MNKTKLMLFICVFLGFANLVLTYSCFEIQEKQFRQIAWSVADTINMIDENINFEHKEEN